MSVVEGSETRGLPLLSVKGLRKSSDHGELKLDSDLFSRETSAGGVSAVSCATSRKVASCDETSGSDAELELSGLNDDVHFAPLLGVWWSASGERYNVEKTARGQWRCIRRGLQLGRQRAYALTREAALGRVVLGSPGHAYTLDNVIDDTATWHSLKANGRRVTWHRTKPAEAPTQPPVAEEKAPEERIYSKSALLQARLRLLAAQPASSPAARGKKPLGISAKSKAQQESCAFVEGLASPPTTVMLRNLPNQCSRGMVVKWLCGTEFSGDFDLVYIPVDRISGNNLGYAFINFVEATACERFTSTIHGTKAARCFPGSRSGKVLQVCYAKVQGKAAYCQSGPGAAEACEFSGPQPEAPGFVPAWFAAVESMAAAADEAKENKEPAESSSGPYKGMRADAPDFVPCAAAAAAAAACDERLLEAQNMHAARLLEALIGMPISEYSKQEHRQAAARARHYAEARRDHIFVPCPASSEQEMLADPATTE